MSRVANRAKKLHALLWDGQKKWIFVPPCVALPQLKKYPAKSYKLVGATHPLVKRFAAGACVKCGSKHGAGKSKKCVEWVRRYRNYTLVTRKILLHVLGPPGRTPSLPGTLWTLFSASFAVETVEEKVEPADVEEACEIAEALHEEKGEPAGVVETPVEEKGEPDGPTIEGALEFHGHETPTPEAMARYLGFDDEQIAMLDRFWDPAFNKSWFYLDDDTILKYMTDGNSRNAISRFAKTLKAEYDTGVDFREIARDDKLVKNFMHHFAVHGNVPKKSNRKKYYAVSGECLKMLLQSSKTKAGRDVRRYFVKVEELAFFQHQYIAALNAALLNAKVKELERQNTCQGEYILNVSQVEKTSALYIVSCASRAKQNHYKIGSIDSYSLKSAKGRLSGYNTGATSADPFKFNYIKHVYKGKDLDTHIRRLFAPFKANKRKEYVCLDFEKLKLMIDRIADSHNQNYEMVNQYIQNEHRGYSHVFTKPDIVDLGAVFATDLDNADLDNADLDNADLDNAGQWQTPAQKKTIMLSLLENEPDPVSWAEFYPKIVDHLRLTPSKVKKTPWKEELKKISHDTEIRVVWRR